MRRKSSEFSFGLRQVVLYAVLTELIVVLLAALGCLIHAVMNARFDSAPAAV